MPTTQITRRQIADGAVDNSKVAAGAAIATNKLAEGAEFVKRDGSVVMTGSLDSGNNRIVNVATPAAGTDAVNRNYVDQQVSNIPALISSKGTVKAASAANVTVSAPGATLDGVTLAANDRVLLKNQTAPAQNGIYVWSGPAAALARSADFDAWNEIPGSIVVVEQGTANADTVWLCTSDSGGTLGTTAVTFQQIQLSAGLINSNFVVSEVPSGTVNGSNVTFTLANTPVTGSLQVWVNGLLQQAGASNDYTATGTSLAFTAAATPQTGDQILVAYRR